MFIFLLWLWAALPPILLRFWLSALKGKPIPLKTTQRRRALRQTGWTGQRLLTQIRIILTHAKGLCSKCETSSLKNDIRSAIIHFLTNGFTLLSKSSFRCLCLFLLFHSDEQANLFPGKHFLNVTTWIPESLQRMWRISKDLLNQLKHHCEGNRVCLLSNASMLLQTWF